MFFPAKFEKYCKLYTFTQTKYCKCHISAITGGNGSYWTIFVTEHGCLSINVVNQLAWRILCWQKLRKIR